MAYPVRLERDDRGAVLVSFPDIPEALTEGATEGEALAEAQDCLIAALGGYMDDRRDIPRSSPGRGRPLVALLRRWPPPRSLSTARCESVA